MHGLIDISLINGNYHMYAADIFNKKYPEKVVSISKSGENSYTLKVDNEISENVDVRSVHFLFKYLGEYVSELIIGFSSDTRDDYLQKCLEFASRYCTNLRKIDIRSGQDALIKVQNPFYSVTEVRFFMSVFQRHMFNFKGTFPNVQKLQLDWVKIKGDDFFYQQSPKLDKLSVRFGFWLEDENVMKIIEKNPQIQSLSIEKGNATLVKLANEHLPNLETLVLPSVTVDYTDEIHFKNVNTFDIEYVSGGLLNVTFEQLNELTCNIEHFPNWIETIENHPNLRMLKLKNKGGVQNEHIVLMTKKAKHLVEANFNCHRDMQVQTIVNLLNECKHMKKLYLGTRETHQIFMEKLIQNIRDRWTVRRLNDSFLIERK